MPRQGQTSQTNPEQGLSRAARTVEAITLFEEVLAARERVPGPGQPDTLILRNNLETELAMRRIGLPDARVAPL